MALRMLQEAMNGYYNGLIVHLVAQHLLIIMRSICEFQLQQVPVEINNGRLYFGENRDKTVQALGLNFHLLALECVYVWSQWYSTIQDQSFVKLYNDLLSKGVQFPIFLSYYKESNFEPRAVVRPNTFNTSLLCLSQVSIYYINIILQIYNFN